MARIFTELMTHYDKFYDVSSASYAKTVGAKTLDCPTTTAPALQPSKSAQAVVDNVKAMWSGLVPPTLASGYSALNHLSGGRLDQQVQRTVPAGSALQNLALLSATQDQALRDKAHALRDNLIHQPGQSAIDALTYVPNQLKALGYELAKTWHTAPETFAAAAALGSLELVRGPVGKAGAISNVAAPPPGLRLEYRVASIAGQREGAILVSGQDWVRVKTFRDPKEFSIESHGPAHALYVKEKTGGLSPGVIEGRNLDNGGVLITRFNLNPDLSTHHPQMLQQALGWASWGGQGRAPTTELRIQKRGIDPAHLNGDLMEQALGSMGIKIMARGSVRENGHEVAVFKTAPTASFSPDAARLPLNPLPLNVEFLPLTNYLPTHEVGGSNVLRGRFGQGVFPTHTPDPKVVDAVKASIVSQGFDPLGFIDTVRLIDTLNHELVVHGHARLKAIDLLGKEAGLPAASRSIPRYRVPFNEVSHHVLLKGALDHSGLGQSHPLPPQVERYLNRR